RILSKDGAIEFSFTALTFVGAIGSAERLPTPCVHPITPPGKIGLLQVSRTAQCSERPNVNLHLRVRHPSSERVGRLRTTRGRVRPPCTVKPSSCACARCSHAATSFSNGAADCRRVHRVP